MINFVALFAAPMASPRATSRANAESSSGMEKLPRVCLLFRKKTLLNDAVLRWNEHSQHCLLLYVGAQPKGHARACQNNAKAAGRVHRATSFGADFGQPIGRVEHLFFERFDVRRHRWSVACALQRCVTVAIVDQLGGRQNVVGAAHAHDDEQRWADRGTRLTYEIMYQSATNVNGTPGLAADANV